MSVKVVNSGSGVINITAETIPTIKVSSPEVTVVDINPVVTGSTVGPTGPTGATGATGAGVKEGGSENQFLQKNSATDYDTKWSAYTLPAADGENAQVLVTDGAGALTFDHVRSIRITIRNDEGATIPAGTPIYSRGEIGGSERILVGIADASDPAKMPAIGIAETTLTTAGDTKDGYAIMSGVFNTNVSGFTGLSEGDILYVSNSGGGLIQTKPTGTYLIQNVGIVLKTNGTILQGFQVACIGRTNDVPNIPEDYFWIGNSSGVATPTDFDTRVASAPAVVANTAKPDGTDLSVSTTSDNVTVISDTGTNATITEATASQAGVMTVTMHDKLDAIAANADVTNSTNVDAAGAIMHSDIAANGFIRRTGAETYDQITPGTGLSVSAGTLNVADTTLAAVDNTGDVDIKVTGPSGNQDTGVNLDSANALLAIASAANNITFTVDANLASYTNNAGFLTSSSLTTHTFEASGSSSQVVLTSVGADGTSDTVTIDAGTNISFSTPTAAGFTIASSITNAVDDLNDLTDVTVSGEAANDYLVYDSGLSAFVNQPLDISHDTTPTLGGDLNVSGNQIVSSSNGAIVITPDGTGNVKLGNFEFDVDQDLTGKDDFVLTYDTVSRTISLEAASGGVDTSGTPADDQIAVFTDADTVEGSSGLTYDGSTFVADAVAQFDSVKIGNQGSSVLNAAGKFDFGARVTYDLGTGTSLLRGDVYSYKGSWTKSDADAESTSKGLLGVAVGTSASAGFVLQGVVRMQDNTGFPSGTTSGEVLYLDTEEGHVTVTKPTGTGDIVRVVGYVIDAANKIIYFDPSKDWIQLA
jgi:hypothetical protein